ncbi:hypothetical protein ACLK1W_00415 [Escherichia coli]
MPNIDKAIISVHCHDDLGRRWPTPSAPCRWEPARLSAPINGIGERAGNCSLEEVAMRS